MGYSATFGGQSGGTPRQWATATSATFTTPRAGKYRITLVGVGSGAANSAQAGSSGAIAQSLVTLAAGVALTATLGAPGLAAASPTAGGTSTIAGAGLATLTCTGGTPSVPGVATGGNVFNRPGVAGAVGPSKGGSSVAVYGTGFAATTSGGAGVGESAPTTGMIYAGGAAITGLTNISGHVGGRLLQPAGIGGYGMTAASSPDAVGRPGGGGGSDINGYGYRGGMFAGGSGAAGSGCPAGKGGVGGGGGGSCSSGGAGGNGGEAMAVIEWMED